MCLQGRNYPQEPQSPPSCRSTPAVVSDTSGELSSLKHMPWPPLPVSLPPCCCSEKPGPSSLVIANLTLGDQEGLQPADLAMLFSYPGVLPVVGTAVTALLHLLVLTRGLRGSSRLYARCRCQRWSSDLWPGGRGRKALENPDHAAISTRLSKGVRLSCSLAVRGGEARGLGGDEAALKSHPWCI